MDANLCEPILSICIPTYNRCEKLYADITKWLKSENKKFEIVVSDNCSNNGTQEKLSSIKDDRFVFLQNHTNMGTSYNSKKAMLNGRGKYLMQLMDKDFVNLEYIDEIINYLEKK